MTENNLQNKKTPKIPWYPIISILTIAAIITIAFVTIKLTGEASAEKIKQIAPMVATHETEIAVLKVAQTYIKETVTDVKEEQKAQRRLLERIDDKIP